MIKMHLPCKQSIERRKESKVQELELEFPKQTLMPKKEAKITHMELKVIFSQKLYTRYLPETNEDKVEFPIQELTTWF